MRPAVSYRLEGKAFRLPDRTALVYELAVGVQEDANGFGHESVAALL
jgi:hypothetical protein